MEYWSEENCEIVTFQQIEESLKGKPYQVFELLEESLCGMDEYVVVESEKFRIVVHPEEFNFFVHKWTGKMFRPIERGAYSDLEQLIGAIEDFNA
jgi:hypothetical protein